jgi:ferritin-like metal-binding protein YciE
VSAVPGKAPAVKRRPQVETGRALLLEELGRLLTVEETLARLVLPELLRELDDDGLTKVLSEHLDQTRDHVGNLKRAFLALGAVPAGRPAYGLDGLRTEHGAEAPTVAPNLRAAVHVAAAMGTEHYEINAYEGAIRLAHALGAEDVCGLLRANLDQEVEALQTLGREAYRLAQLAVEQ